MYSIRDEYIYYPRNMEELSAVMERYEEKDLPGCGGSIDVVHLKWSNCPAGDKNRSKGKEGYPTVALEVVSGFDRQILGISSIQFGTRNDKHIVKIDETVKNIRTGWYKDVEWYYYDEQGNKCKAFGVYFVCDGGYLRWPVLICPYQGASAASQGGYFSSNLESVRKDVECVFGILKKRWKILEYGIRFRDIKVVEKTFVVCCMLHNMMLSEMETRESSHKVGKGAPVGQDAIFLEGPRSAPVLTNCTKPDRLEAQKWCDRRKALAAHLQYSKQVVKRRRVE
jgi:hypothetical protein